MVLEVLLGCILGAFGTTWGTLGVTLRRLGVTWDPLGLLWGALGCPLGSILRDLDVFLTFWASNLSQGAQKHVFYIFSRIS